jgi:DNA-binding Lrp family transcriptional regulator
MVLNESDRGLIAAVQDGLPLVAHPYAVLAETLGTSEADIIERLQRLQDNDLIKRMGVVVKHRALGYHANAMVVWDVPDNDIERVGKLLAAQECVTLCYQRPRRLPDWPYNLFCMIHGRERKAVLRRLEQIIAVNDLGDLSREVLFSLRSFKQRGARYAARLAGAAHG